MPRANRESAVARAVMIMWAAVAMLAGAAQASAASIELTSPLNYQVFQRQTLERGKLLIRGRLDAAGGQVQYRLTGKPAVGSLSEEWTNIALDPAAVSFSASPEVPAGGWYTLEIRVRNEEAMRAQNTIAHVGIGEVFIVAGQSNSTNFGSERQTVKGGHVATFDGSHWRIADDPQPGVQDGSTGGSFLPAFGDAIAGRFHVPVGVASVGCGATSVREWLPKGSRMQQPPTTGGHVTPAGPGQWESTGQLYDGLLRRMSDLGAHGFRAVLWHQGESDAGQVRGGYPAAVQITGKQYEQYMKAMIDSARAGAGWNVPWFVAQATYHSENDSHDPEFRAAQHALVEARIAYEGPDTDALGAPYRAGVHFNPKGLQAHGELWAEKLGAFIDRDGAAPTSAPVSRPAP